MSLYREVRRGGVLRQAWAHIRDNGRVSRCAKTRREVAAFEEAYPTHLQRIARQLREERFVFSPAVGVPVERPGKRARPIVVAPIGNRVIQRALLLVLQRQEGLTEYLLSPGSFGGVRNRAVPHAIGAVLKARERGARFYLRSDIRDFFPGIPRERVLKRIAENIPPDELFLKLLGEAVDVELSNLEELGERSELFPTHDIGVAQGNCLSVLIGNVLLFEFDRLLNGRGITCIRYIDDFILLGPDRRSVRKAFEVGVSLLQELGLRAYHPDEPGTKAQEGSVTGGFEFLGCRILPGLIMPTGAAQDRVKRAVEEAYRQSERRLSGAGTPSFDVRRYSVATTVYNVRNIVSGWVDQYAHCTDEAFRRNLTAWLEARTTRYQACVDRAARAGGQAALRALGVRPFIDGKRSERSVDDQPGHGGQVA